MQGLAHRLDALAHRGEFALPGRAQLGVAEHGSDELAAMDRRARVVAPDGELVLAEHVDASSRLAQTTLSAPQRSPYRLMLFENELATKKDSGWPFLPRAAANARTA